MNCKTFQNQIDEFAGQAFTPDEVVQHLNSCQSCHSFKTERAHLHQMLRQLETIDAPADFNFHLKARLRKQKDVTANSGWRTLVWPAAAPATLVVAIALGFVLTKNTLIEPPPAVVSSDAPQLTEMAQVQSTPTNLPAIAPAPPQIKSDRVSKDVREGAVNKAAGQQIAAKRETRSAAVVLSKSKPQSDKEIVRSRDVTVVGSETIGTPKGIPDQLKSPNKLDAKQLLLTLGIETKEDVKGLRVVSVSEQAARSNLRAGDLIQKLNNENPLVVSGNEFKELNLTVRRKEQTQEIKVSVKP